MKGMFELLTITREKQTKVELVMLEQLVPENHLLRKIDEHIDFDFIYCRLAF
jgi:hypothetical protein